MSEVHIPFQVRFSGPMWADVKTMTSRFRWYGMIGDTFWAFGAHFEITTQCSMPLSVVATAWKQEGFDSEAELWDFWRNMHPKRSDPNTMVKVHFFRRLVKAPDA